MPVESSTDLARLARAVEDAGRRTEELVADLADGQLSVPLSEVVNPFLWELGHVAWFWERFHLREVGAAEPLDPGFDDLFDSSEVAHDTRWTLHLPGRGAALDYARRVRERVLGRLTDGPRSGRERYLVELALRHEDMHAEAFAYMRQTLGYAAPAARGDAATEPAAGPLPGDVRVEPPGGTFRLGADPGDGFLFDNEKPAHEIELAPFDIARAPVTNAEFAAFVDDGGYRRRELWSCEGWRWREDAGAAHPVYWVRTGAGWSERRFDERRPLAAHAPVAHVSWHEAEAFCRWADRRLPSEAEWECAASTKPDGDRKRRYPWGDEPPTRERARLDARGIGCVDVGAHAAGDSAWGCRQMLGNVWEWTASAFTPYPGFVVDGPYVAYSAPWFGNRRVLRGGSWATRSRLVTSTHRNFFAPERVDVFAGFRTCAR